MTTQVRRLNREVIGVVLASSMLLAGCASGEALTSVTDPVGSIAEQQSWEFQSSGGGVETTASGAGESDVVNVEPEEVTTTVAVTTTTSAPRGWGLGFGPGHEGVIVGSVIDVVGDLSVTSEFRLLIEDGSEVTFLPAPDVTFQGGPMSHIREHLLSGIPVSVDFIVEQDGTLVARFVQDAEHDH